jgi:hypothetical protein
VQNFLLYFSLSILLLGCSIDDLPGCEGSGDEGLICKEYQYVDGVYNGLNNYYYDESGSILLSKVTQSKSGKKDGSVFYNYNSINELVCIEYINYLGDVARVKTIKYDDGYVVEEENSGDINDKIIYQYSSGLLENVIYMEGNIIKSEDSLEYFENTSDLYKTVKYSGGILSSITYNVWFGSSILKQTVYDNGGNKKGSIVRRYSPNKVLTEKVDYNFEDEVIFREVYKYIAGYLVEIIKEEGGEMFEKIVYQRF